MFFFSRTWVHQKFILDRFTAGQLHSSLLQELNQKCCRQLPCERSDNVSKLLSNHALIAYLHFSLLLRSLFSNSSILSRFNTKALVLVGLEFSLENPPQKGAASHLMENPYCVICKKFKNHSQPATCDAITSVWPKGKTVMCVNFQITDKNLGLRVTPKYTKYNYGHS